MNRLKEFRENRGLSQFALGKIINVYPQKISDFECGRRDLRLGEAKLVADFLNISLDELIGRSVLASSSNGNASE
jgi:transcriptional regulator with XRE-family HTH domain